MEAAVREVAADLAKDAKRRGAGFGEQNNHADILERMHHFDFRNQLVRSHNSFAICSLVGDKNYVFKLRLDDEAVSMCAWRDRSETQVAGVRPDADVLLVATHELESVNTSEMQSSLQKLAREFVESQLVGSDRSFIGAEHEPQNANKSSRWPFRK
jgi:hypothetical protein